MTEVNPLEDIELDILPRRDRLIVQECVFDKTEGGILLTSSGMKDAKDLARGKVIAIGPWVNDHVEGKSKEADIELGDIVCFGPYAGVPIKVQRKEGFKLIPVADVLAVQVHKEAEILEIKKEE